MCGIAGFCSFENNFLTDPQRWTQVLIGMRRSISHRGSDQTGEYLRENVGLSHTRLSIRDVSGGAQPMIRRVGDYEYAVSYNGEIYNADELKRELEGRGYKFSTTCDTEVLLYCYIEYGERCASRLNGIFAFAVWDGRKKRLILSRDQLGVKPLFYSVQGGFAVFGSEIKALFCHPDITAEADDDSFREIFAVGPARTPGCGVFKGVGELKAGETAIYSRDGFFKKSYHRLRAQRHEDSYEKTVETVRYLLCDAVKRQLVSDVPVCSFLSGGLDSSIITAVAADIMEKNGERLSTFSFDFTDNSLYFKANGFQPSSDRPFVDLLLPSLNVSHSYLECDELTLADRLYDAVISKDLPGMTDVDASLMYFCSLVKQKNKVALTGECSDEIFGGYPWFYRRGMLNADGFPWSHDMDARLCLLKDEVIYDLSLRRYSHEKYAQTIAEAPVLEGESAQERRIRQVYYLNIKWFMQTLLDRMDRASMSCALEARVPFADIRLVEYMYNVPWSMKYRNGQEKSLLRDAFSHLLPPQVLGRKKSPYPKTYNPAYEKILCERFKTVLSDSTRPLHRFIDRAKAERFLSAQKDYARPWFGQLMAGPQMIAYMLEVNFWLEHYKLM